MTTLPPFFAAGTCTGSRETIEMQIVFWTSVGWGTFTSFGAYSASFAGQLRTAFFSGPLQLDIHLTDEDPSARRGPASVALNGATDLHATYEVSGSQLLLQATLGGRPETIALSPGDGGTSIGLSGAFSRALWLKSS